MERNFCLSIPPDEVLRRAYNFFGIRGYQLSSEGVLSKRPEKGQFSEPVSAWLTIKKEGTMITFNAVSEGPTTKITIVYYPFRLFTEKLVEEFISNISL